MLVAGGGGHKEGGHAVQLARGLVDLVISAHYTNDEVVGFFKVIVSAIFAFFYLNFKNRGAWPTRRGSSSLIKS
jgi:hypothetical protein